MWLLVTLSFLGASSSVWRRAGLPLRVSTEVGRSSSPLVPALLCLLWADHGISLSPFSHLQSRNGANIFCVGWLGGANVTTERMPLPHRRCPHRVSIPPPLPSEGELGARTCDLHTQAVPTWTVQVNRNGRVESSPLENTTPPCLSAAETV